MPIMPAMLVGALNRTTTATPRLENSIPAIRSDAAVMKAQR
jgi:hypothetical protein